MALVKRNPAAGFEQPKTEAAPAATNAPAAQPAAAAPAPAPAAQPATPAPAPAAQPAPVTNHQVATAPAPAAAPLVLAPNTQVAAITNARAAMDSLKDALRVDWDTLVRLKANQGRLASADGKLVFGEFVIFELLSYQDNWLISPGKDTDEARDLARYSDDGIHVKDTGETCTAYIERLKGLDYPDARMSKRVILVASLVDCEKDVTIDDGMLFQIDLPPTSRAAFERYKNQAAFDLAKGKIQPSDVVRIKATATIQQQKGNPKNEYTELSFSRAPAA